MKKKIGSEKKETPTTVVINGVDQAIEDGLKIPISFEPEDIGTFRKIFPNYYVYLENIAIRRMLAQNKL